MEKIWDIFEENEKKKKSPVWDMFAEVGTGISAKAEGGIALPEPTPPEPITTPGVSQRMRGIGEVPKDYGFEGVTIELKKASSKLSSLWRSELKTTDDKGKFLKHENWSPELQEADLEVQRLQEQASKMGVNMKDWINYGVYSAFFASMAASVLPVVSQLPKNILNNLTYKIEGKIVKGQELKNVLKRVAYPETGKPSIFDRKVFDEFTKRGGIKGIGGSLKKGITITEVKPRFAFAGKLYGGLPADAIVKSIVETGKITADISRELSLAKPELVTQVIQNLSIASPAIASKLAPKLVELIPEVKAEAKVMTFEEYASSKGTSFMSFSEPALHRQPGASEKQIKKSAKDIFDKGTEWGKQRDILREEYDKKIASGEIREPNRIEKLINTARGHPDNESVQAARRLLDKKGINWKLTPEPPAEIPKVEGKELEPLAVEARKYGSAEEFVESRKYYHGTDKDIDISKLKPSFPEYEGSLGEGIYLGEQKETAEFYGRNVHEVYADIKNPLIIDMLEGENVRIAPEIEKKYNETGMYSSILIGERIPPMDVKIKGEWYEIRDSGDLENIGEWAREAGHDAVIARNLREGSTVNEEVLIFDKSQIKTKAQLTDFYNQATAKPIEKVAEVTPKPEVLKVKPKPYDLKKDLTAEQKIEGKPKPEVKVEIIPKVEVATPVQIKKAHAIANSKALISDKGKMKPQYREIAKVFTGEKSVKDMTPEQAEMFIDMLSRLPEPKYRAGKLVPPSIPRTMKLTTEGFFRKQYGEPTPIWLLTDQTYYTTKLGIKPLVAPYEKGKQEFDLEFRQSSRLVDKVVVKLNQIAKTPGWDRIKSKVKNIPTKAESKMAGLLNKHEATPPGLSEGEEDVFKYFRNLSKDIWRRENEVREKVDLPPIKYKTAYFRHTADAMAKEMLEGKYPFPQGIKYWSQKMVGKKIFNPMEFKRKLSDDLVDLWSKDIRAVTKAMLWNGLKEIHLAEPAKFLNEQLNAISKDLPEYKNLTPSEQKAYDQTQVMPASTKKWLIDYVNQVLKGQETELDASLNRIVTKSGLKGIFDKVLSPFGRSIGRKPITSLFSLSGRLVISGVMGWVPRQIIRNVFQQVQNLALYGVKATVKAFLPASIDKNLKGLLTESLFMKSYTGFEELPTNLMGKLEKVWLGPYGIVAVNNAKQGMKAAFWNVSELIKNPKFKKYGWADPQRTKDTPKGFLYPSEKEKLLKEMEFGSSCTQYQYIPLGMPGVFRYKALIPFTRLQSWWMNYFTKFNREAFHRLRKGETSYGAKLPWSRRINWAKYLILGGAILTALGYKKSFMLGVLPGYLSPAGQLTIGFYNYVTAKSDWQRKRALNQIYYSWKAFIPGSLAWRDFLAVWKGEKDLEEILFYGKKEEKKAVPKSDIWKKIEGEKPKGTKSEVWKIFD